MIRTSVSLPVSDPVPFPAWWDEPDVVFYLYAGISAICLGVILGVIVVALFRRRSIR